MKENYQDINARTIDHWVEEGWEWGTPIDHDTFLRARAGDWQVVLTPTRAVPKAWFPPLEGAKLLGLASGGGQQMPIFAALGADCTVLDYSPKQLESEELVARREGYAIRILRGDMTQPLPFADETFDVIFHPVSNSYVEKVEPVFRECYRVLKKGGVLLCGLDTGLNYVMNEEETELTYPLPFNPLKDDALMAECLARWDGVQFSHTLEEQIGGQLAAGLRLTHLMEDTNGSGRLKAFNVPTFIATRAVKEG